MGAFAIYIGSSGPNPFSIRVTTPPGNLTPAAASVATSGGDPSIASPPATPRGLATAALFVLPIEDGAQVTYSFKTNILPSRDGLERRIATVACPRETYDFTTLLSDTQFNLLQSQLVANAAKAQAFALALAHEQLLVTGGAGNTVNVGTTTLSDWVYPGQTCVVISPDGATVVQTFVQSSTTTSITLGASVGAAGVYGAVILPTIPCYLDETQAFGIFANNVDRLQLKARSTYFGNAASDWAPVGASVTTYTDPFTAQVYAVWDRPIRISSETSDRAAVAGVELMDRGAVLTIVGPRPVVDWKRVIEMTIRTDADRQFVKKFWGTVVGCQQCFLLPTWKPDLIPLTDASSSTLKVKSATNNGVDYAGTWFTSPAQKHLQLLKTDGTVAYVAVSDATDNLDGTETLQLDRAVTGALSRVSFLETCRFDSDDLIVRYQSRLGRIRVPVQVVQQ